MTAIKSNIAKLIRLIRETFSEYMTQKVTHPWTFVVAYMNRGLLDTSFPDERKLLMDSITPTLTAKHLTIVHDPSKLTCLLYGFVPQRKIQKV